MKFLLILLVSVFSSIELKENFYQEVSEGYEVYREVVNYENPYYEISIIQGINNDEVTFGLYFYNHKPSSDPHRVIIFTGEKEYRLKTNSRKDIYAPAIKLEKDVKIIIYDSFGRERGTSYYIDAMNAEDFKILYDDYLIGDNMGLNLSSLSRNLPSLTLQGLLLIIFGGIIVILGLVILFLFITKKGMFSEKKKAENIFNFREFAQTLFEQAQKEEIRLRENEFEERFNEQIDEEPKQIYERQRIYDDVDETVDVTKILKDKGFNVDYPSLSEAEKNEIMLELMLLRDLKDITLEQYQQEVIKLWSK